MKIRALSLVFTIALLSGCASAPRTDANLSAEHNARLSLDWAGSYRGVLPCADCAGIKSVVTLTPDGSYETRSTYLGKSDAVLEEKGRFSWDAAGNIIQLGQSDPVQYFVSENRLIRLAPDGSRIKGALADQYILTKE